MSKRAISANDVYHTNAHGQEPFARTLSSEYASIPEDVQSRLQSMSWRIRSSEFYAGALLTCRREPRLQQIAIASGRAYGCRFSCGYAQRGDEHAEPLVAPLDDAMPDR